MHVWVAALILSLLANLSQASDLPSRATHTEFPVPGATSVLLGRDLFYDPILSGNRDISCASCHVPATGTTSRLPLATNPKSGKAHILTARNVPALYNLGAHEISVLGHAGSVARDDRSRFGIRLPDGLYLERPLPSPLAARALMSLVTPTHMAGLPGDNPVAKAVSEDRVMGLHGAWQIIARRVEETPEYRRRFSALIGTAEPIHVTHIARVLGDFISFEFRATDSAFDAFLRGEDTALGNAQLRGMSLFYGKAGCATCHSGTLQTDQKFHAIGLPQIGPGMGHGPGYADFGRAAITGDSADLYRFRTPSLRNVALTAPYGHDGVYDTLERIIRHHLDPATALAEYEVPMAQQAQAMSDFDEVLNIFAASEITPVALRDDEIGALVTFLHALTDPHSVKGRLGPPDQLPSGLPKSGATPPS